MAKRAVSITLDETNLLWLKGQGYAHGNLSAAVDELITAARAGRFGVPHTSWGEEVAAAVTLNGEATEAELLAYCKERLADFKRPKQIHITTTIPRTATGKIQRRVVAQAFAQT